MPGKRKSWKILSRRAGSGNARNFLKSPGISVVRDARIAMQSGGVHAMHDPTEGGLATGLLELAQAADVGLLVEREKIAVFPETEILCKELGLDPLGLIASGALLIAAPPRDAERIKKALRRGGIPAESIGRTWEKEKGVKMLTGGEIRDLPVFPRDEIARFFEGSEGPFTTEGPESKETKKQRKFVTL